MATDSTFRPTGDGSFEEWTLSAGSDSYALVDETSANGDTDYIYHNSTFSAKKTYFTSDLSSIPDGHKINSVKIYINAKRYGSTVYKCRCDVYDGTNTASVETDNLTTDYAEYSVTMTTNPSGGSWTRADLIDEDFEFGIYSGKMSVGNYIRVTQIYLVVNHEEDATRLYLTHGVKLEDTDFKKIAMFCNITKLRNTNITNLVDFEAYEPDWWDESYLKRRQLLFGNNHDAYPDNYTVRFNLNTGYEQIIATNGLDNESIQHSGTHVAYYNGCLYYVWLAEGTYYLEVKIKKYTIATDTWSSEYLVGETTTTSDFHYAPVIAIDNSGYIHVAYNAHGTPCYYRRSSNPEDITAWDSVVSMGGGQSYPRLVCRSNGQIYLFAREGAELWGYRVSYNGGSTWVTGDDGYPLYHPVIDYSDNYGGTGSVYCGGVNYDADNDICHICICFWDWYGGANKGRAVTYFYTDDFLNFTCMDDSEFSIYDPGTYEDCELIFESGDPWPDTGPYYITNSQGLAYDSNGYPHFLVQAWYTYCKDEPCELWYVKWTGSEWSKTELTALSGSPQYMFNHRQGGCIYIDGSDVYIYASMKPTTSEEQWSPELYIYKGANLGTSWSHWFATMNTSYGIPMMSVLQKKYPNVPRILFYSRGNNLVVSKDEYNSQFRTDGADVRIVRHDCSGESQSDTEYDRLPDRWQAEDTEIAFMVDEPIGENRNFIKAYDGFWVYYNKYNATDPPHDVDDIFIYYDSFESYDVGDDLADTVDWTGSGADYTIMNYYRSDLYSYTATNKLYAGENYVYISGGSDSDYTRSMNINLSEHYLEVWFRIEYAASGTKFFFEYYDSSSGKWSRIGIKDNYAGYHNSGGVWTDSSVERGSIRRFVKLSTKIDANGISGWYNDELIVSNNNHMTTATTIRIGHGGGASGSTKITMDKLLIRKYVANEQYCILGDIEGEDNMASYNITHGVEPCYSGSYNITHGVKGDKVISYNINHVANVETEDVLSLANLVSGEWYNRLYVAHSIAGDKEFYLNNMHQVNLEATTVRNIAHELLMLAESDLRIAHNIAPEKTTLLNIASGAPLKAEDFVKIVNVAVAVATEQLRLYHKLQLMKTWPLNIAMFTDVSQVNTLKILHKVFGNKIETINLCHSILGEATNSLKIMQIVATEKTATINITHRADLLALKDLKLSHHADLSDESYSRIANYLQMQYERRHNIAHSSGMYGDKRLYLCHYIMFVAPTYGTYFKDYDMFSIRVNKDIMKTITTDNDIFDNIIFNKEIFDNIKIDNEQFESIQVDKYNKTPNNIDGKRKY